MHIIWYIMLFCYWSYKVIFTSICFCIWILASRRLAASPDKGESDTLNSRCIGSRFQVPSDQQWPRSSRDLMRPVLVCQVAHQPHQPVMGADFFRTLGSQHGSWKGRDKWRGLKRHPKSPVCRHQALIKHICSVPTLTFSNYRVVPVRSAKRPSPWSHPLQKLGWTVLGYWWDLIPFWMLLMGIVIVINSTYCGVVWCCMVVWYCMVLHGIATQRQVLPQNLDIWSQEELRSATAWTAWTAWTPTTATPSATPPEHLAASTGHGHKRRKIQPEIKCFRISKAKCCSCCGDLKYFDVFWYASCTHTHITYMGLGLYGYVMVCIWLLHVYACM